MTTSLDQVPVSDRAQTIGPPPHTLHFPVCFSRAGLKGQPAVSHSEIFRLIPLFLLLMKKPRERSMFYEANTKTFRNARLLRASETPAEKLLWTYLCKKQLSGFRFKRQHPVSNYVADFYCHRAKLVIEIDETYHNSRQQKLYDKIRNEDMRALGLHVLRFSTNEIVQDIEGVISLINQTLKRSPPA